MNNWRADPTQPTAEAMICQLAGMCDGAATLDGTGFNRLDTAFGHSLASQAASGRAWSDKQASAALKLITKYQKQLGGADFVKSWLKAPNFARLPAQENSNKIKPVRKLTSRDKSGIFSFPYNPEVVTAIKTIRGSHKDQPFRATYQPADRTWIVPVNESSISQIMQVAQEHEFEVEERFKIFWDRVQIKQAETQAKADESGLMLALNGGDNVAVTGDEILIAVNNTNILDEFTNALRIALAAGR